MDASVDASAGAEAVLVGIDSSGTETVFSAEESLLPQPARTEAATIPAVTALQILRFFFIKILSPVSFMQSNDLYYVYI